MNARLPTFDRRTADEQAEDFDAAVINAMAAARTTVRQKATAGDPLTLECLFDDLCSRIALPGVGANLIRAALSCGPLVAGQMLLDLIGKGVEEEAEVVAIKAVEAMEVMA